MKIGIDKIAFYAPSYYIELEELAKQRNVDPNKYLVGLGQNKTAIIESTQDCVTLAANAAIQILKQEDIEKIDLVLFASESSIDESKAAGIFLQPLLNLRKNCRYVELKQACYSSAIALQFGKNHILQNPNSKVLILASDIAKYGIKSAGEPTQGAGAVAILLSVDPKILVLENETTYISEDISDFFRPTNCNVPIVNGKLSTETYIRFFQTVYNEFKETRNLRDEDFSAICCHMPYAKLGKKAIQSIIQNEMILQRYENSKYYNQNIGNIYTGSLFLSFISLLETDFSLKENDRIGFFAYGSGATGEFFSGILQENYQKYLNIEQHQKVMEQRSKLSIQQYEKLYDQQIDPQVRVFIPLFELEEIKDNVRVYKRNK